MNSKDVKVLSDAGLIYPSDNEIKVRAYESIEELIASPFDYTDENREDLLTLGAIYGVVQAVKAICKEV